MPGYCAEAQGPFLVDYTVSNCPSNVLKLMDDMEASEYKRKRFAVLLVAWDELQRLVPAGEEPVKRKAEKRG